MKNLNKLLAAIKEDVIAFCKAVELEHNHKKRFHSRNNKGKVKEYFSDVGTKVIQVGNLAVGRLEDEELYVARGFKYPYDLPDLDMKISKDNTPSRVVLYNGKENILVCLILDDHWFNAIIAKKAAENLTANNDDRVYAFCSIFRTLSTETMKAIGTQS